MNDYVINALIVLLFWF